MANYPTFGQLDGSNDEFIDDVTVDRSVNGSLKARAFFPAAKRVFHIKHMLITADANTLKTFYATNRLLTIGFTWQGDGVTYGTCMFLAPPKFVYHTPSLIEVDVTIAEV